MKAIEYSKGTQTNQSHKNQMQEQFSEIIGTQLKFLYLRQKPYSRYQQEYCKNQEDVPY